MEKIFVKDLKDKQAVVSCFRVENKSVLKDKNGRSYMLIHLSDISGSIHSLMWDNVEESNVMAALGEIVKVKGHVQIYQSKPQLVLHTLSPVAAEEYDLGDFVKESQVDPSEMYFELLQIIDSIKNEFIKKILVRTVEEENTKSRILKYPAAKTIHHAHLGGLLEHIISICKIMEFMAAHYRQLNRDLLIFGAIYHDIGKLWELSIDEGFQYTDKGRLIGHMQIACEMIEDYAREISGFPSELKDILKHIILSHHGRLEYGSPKRPKFLEAMVVAMIDDLDSKVDTLTQFMGSQLNHGGDWTTLSPQFERYFYLDILRKTKDQE